MKAQRRAGFTLVELMVSISILSIGIVMVLRSFIAMSSALDVGANRLEAARILETKMDGIEEKLILEKDYEIAGSEEEVTLRNRPARYKLEAADILLEEEAKEGKEDAKSVILVEAKMFLAWKEGQINKDATLATYFQKKKK